MVISILVDPFVGRFIPELFGKVKKMWSAYQNTHLESELPIARFLKSSISGEFVGIDWKKCASQVLMKSLCGTDFRTEFRGDSVRVNKMV